jgi:hypothetical protein
MFISDVTSQASEAILALLASAKDRFPASSLVRVEHAFQIPCNSAEAGRPQSPYQRPEVYFPGLRAMPWHDPADFEGAVILEENCGIIRQELQDLLERREGFEDVSETFLTEGGSWNTFRIPLRRNQPKQNRHLCPQTVEILESIPRIEEVPFFSALTPGTHIKPHCGPWNFRLRIHLGLIVPPGCEIRVADEIRHWEEGRCLAFDDSFEHEIWNNSHGTRYCLIVNVWHPELTPIEMIVLEAASCILNRYLPESKWQEEGGAPGA